MVEILEKTAVPIERIHPWTKNPRDIKKKDLDRLKTQLKRLGQFRNLICIKNSTAPPEAKEETVPDSELIVIDGNQRLKAMQELGFTKVNVTIIKVDSMSELIELSLAANDRAGKYDDGELAELLYPYVEDIPLNAYKVDLAPAASLQSVIDAFTPDLEMEEDKLPEEIDEPVWVQLGDIFEVDGHRIMCGDSLNLDHVKALTGGQTIDMVFTDPPYNVGYESRKLGP